jgi:hypothetical protein
VRIKRNDDQPGGLMAFRVGNYMTAAEQQRMSELLEQIQRSDNNYAQDGGEPKYGVDTSTPIRPENPQIQRSSVQRPVHR